MENKYYDWSEILTKKDKNGQTPGVFMVCSRGRSIGKTTGIAEEMVKKFYSHEPSLLDNLPLEGDQFIILCREKQFLGKLANGIFDTCLAIYHPNVICTEKIRAKGLYSDIYFVTGTDKNKQEVHVGWSISIAAYDGLKLLANTFGKGALVLFDEYQSELDSTYLSDEIMKFKSVMKTLQKGIDKPVKYLPIIMCSNSVSVFSPYMVEANLHRHVKSDTKWVKLDGLVFNKAEIQAINDMHDNDYINRVFSGSDKSTDYKDDSWVNDDYKAICKPDDWGRCDYYCTLISGDKSFAVKYYPEVGLYYIDNKVDSTAPLRYNIRLKDMELNVPVIKTAYACNVLRDAMRHGCVRFNNMGCKMALYDLFIN